MKFSAAFLAAAIPAVLAVGPYGQCGGKSYAGTDTTCVAGYTCTYVSEWYSQCKPTTVQSPSPSPSPSPKISPSPSPSPKMSPSPSPSPSPVNPGTCTIPNTTLVSIPKLPDPFKMISGSRITKKSDWTCRRAELFDQLQKYELGTKPPKPQSVTASLSGSTLTINVSDAGKSISFTVTITKPTSGTAPYPAIIGYGGGSIPIPANVAKINFNNDDIGAQSGSGSRGQGKFYTLYGSGHSAGALTAWAWGVSRIIDALEITPSAQIDTTRIGVTGCSRNGKGALVAGAFDERVALTIPQESGSGGAACWRLSDAQKKSGTDVQTASQIITEQPWTGRPFDQYVNSVPMLPIDHHSLQGLVAPRGLFVIENTDMVWLGAMSTYGCSKASQMIYQGLGAQDNYGYSQIGGHSHCAFPSGQQSELTAFINRFLLNGGGNPGVFRSDKPSNGFNQADWIDWSVPALA